MLDQERGLYIAHSQNGPISIVGKMANRHGLIAGATGTGKTVTLQVLAETFCQAGVPCFMADMKGDLSGISQPGKLSGFIQKRLPEFGIEDPQFQSCPVRFFDVFGEQGHPMRATVSDMGPQLDLRAMLDYVAKNAATFTTAYGNVTAASVGAIQRSLLTLENQGAEKFFGEPAFDVYDLLQCEGGKGIMNVLAADKLMLQPKLYSTFLLWLLSDLYARLPEVGDLDLPKLVFFFDEAHMLFADTSKALTDKIEQVIRLIRSKGVGIYFITQSPTDIPENILGQLGNRVQHALRAYTPKDQKAVRSAAQTFRTNPAFKTEDAILELETGEALVSVLDEKGAPTVVERAKILFPLSQIGAITEEQRADLIKKSRLYGRYEHAIDRESAFEVLLAQSEQAAKEAADAAEEEQAAREAAAAEKEAAKVEKEEAKRRKNSLGSKIFGAVVTAVTASVARSVGSAVSNSLGGKKSTSGKSGSKSAAGKAASTAASAATRTLTRELTRSILGNLIR